MPSKKVIRNETQVTNNKQSVAVTKPTQTVRGRVVSSKTPQTAKVVVEWKKIHPLFKKGFMQSKKYLVHTLEAVSEGDIVEIVKVRPISKFKHWQVIKVLGKDIVVVATKQLKEKAAEAIAEVMPEKETQPSDVSLPVVSESEADQPKTGKPKSESRKQKTDNRRSK